MAASPAQFVQGEVFSKNNLRCFRLPRPWPEIDVFISFPSDEEAKDPLLSPEESVEVDSPSPDAVSESVFVEPVSEPMSELMSEPAVFASVAFEPVVSELVVFEIEVSGPVEFVVLGPAASRASEPSAPSRSPEVDVLVSFPLELPLLDELVEAESPSLPPAESELPPVCLIESPRPRPAMALSRDAQSIPGLSLLKQLVDEHGS
ncbi:MAG: hypothetical protein Q9166_004658 [cf. Caloplaca sp. 2 TL-2023]